MRIWELYDGHFTTLVSSAGSEVSVELLCLDPSAFLDASMALGRASVLFSATLAPIPYFIETPVSYTHLDVYKRQPMCRSLLFAVTRSA